MKNLLEVGGVTLVIIAIIFLGIFWPLVLIWSLNTLFGLGIAYTFINWLAMLVITISFGKASVNAKK